MKQDVNALLAEKNAMIVKGQIVEASEKFYAPNTKTIDFTGTITNGKVQHTQTMKDFVGNIAKVNEITFHRSASDGDVSFSEFTFDFDMKDGSKIHWHEILRSIWKDGLIVEEQYFQG